MPTGSVKLLKVSSKNEINQSNASYTFSGALYGLYKDSGCKEKIGEFKIDENGKSNVIEDLDIGTYYINEILAPHGIKKIQQSIRLRLKIKRFKKSKCVMFHKPILWI